MKHTNATWKSLREDYPSAELFDGFVGAFLLSTVLFIPIMIILIELVSIYLYRLTFLSFMIIIALFGYIAFIHFLWRKSLVLKKPEHNTNILNLFLKTTIIINSVVLVLGILVIFVLIPILFV